MIKSLKTEMMEIFDNVTVVYRIASNISSIVRTCVCKFRRKLSLTHSGTMLHNYNISFAGLS